MTKGSRVVPPLLCSGIFVLLAVTLLPLVFHKSQQPWLFGLYSKLYCLIVVLHFTALALTISALRWLTRNWTEISALARTYGFWFWLFIWLLFVLGSFCIYGVTQDGDFRHLGFAILSAGVCVGWVILYFARRCRRLLTNLALAFSVSILVLLGGEIVLALFPITRASKETVRAQKLMLYEFQRAARSGAREHRSGLMPDAELGFRQKPDFLSQQTRLHNGTSMEVRTDCWGFFNQEFDPSRSYDVACVGDSFVAMSWPRLVQARTGLWVASFGVPAYSPPQYTIVMKRYALKVRSKVVFYCIYLNDAAESAIFEDWKRSGMDWFTFKSQEWLGGGSSHAGRLFLEEQLLRYSRIYSLLDSSTIRQSDPAIPITAQPISYQTEKFRLVFDRGSFAGMSNPDNDLVRRGIVIIRDNVNEASRLAREADAKMIVLLLPPKELVHYEALNERAQETDVIANLPRFYEALRKICQELRIEHYDLTERFKAEVGRTGKAFYAEVDTHWDADGLELMAQIVTEILNSLDEFRGQIGPVGESSR